MAFLAISIARGVSGTAVAACCLHALCGHEPKPLVEVDFAAAVQAGLVANEPIGRVGRPDEIESAVL